VFGRYHSQQVSTGTGGHLPQAKYTGEDVLALSNLSNRKDVTLRRTLTTRRTHWSSVLAQMSTGLFASSWPPLGMGSTPAICERAHGWLTAKRSWFVALDQHTPVTLRSLIATYNGFYGGQDFLDAALDDNLQESLEHVTAWPPLLQSSDCDTLEGGCIFHSSCVGRKPSHGNINTLINPTKGEVVKLAPTIFDRCGRWFESQCRHTLSVLGGFG
jgi:hypothetical protein